MRRALLSTVLLVTLLCGATAVEARPPSSLSTAGAEEFPQRAYRLTVPERRGLGPQDVTVTENGDPVSKLSLASAEGGGGGEFGAILVIDASSSMHGQAIRSAVDAARVLARQRTGTQRLGVIVFNRTPRVLLAPTADQSAIDRALATTPPLASQTRIFDAVGTALDLLRTAHITAGSIVVLSDGSDTGSRAGAMAVTARARRANVTIHTVGLRSGAFESGELRNLAAAGQGSYTAAASVFDLRRVFRELGAQLATDYLVSYRSVVEPGTDVTVAVRVQGVDGVATSTYTVPGGASFVEVKRNFWTSGLGTALTAVMCSLLLALSIGILLVRRTRGPSLRDRIREFVAMPGDLPAATEDALTGRAPSSTERSLERTQWWAAFKRDVEIARIAVDPVRIVVLTAFATVVAMFLLALLTGIALVGFFALVIPWGVRTWVRVRLERQRELFIDQLPEMLQGAASAIRAGHGLVGALSIVAEESAEPSRSEFLRVVADEGLGMPLDEALRVVQERMRCREVLQIALVAQIQREAGGNMAEVLDRVIEALRQRGELRRMVKALTAQGRLSRWVVTALPLFLLLLITIVNPRYVDPLYTSPLGLFMLIIAALMMLAGSLVIGKIVNFKV